MNVFYSRILPVLVISTASFDNITLTHNASGSTITPFLLLSAMYIVLTIFFIPRLAQIRNIGVNQIALLFALVLFLCITFFSNLLSSNDPLSLSAPRTAFIFYVVLFSYVFTFTLGKHIVKIFSISFIVYVILSLLYSIVQILVYYHIFKLPADIGSFVVLDLSSVAGFPRVEGFVGDPNRFSSFIVFMLAVLFVLYRRGYKIYVPSVLYYLAVLLTVGAFSRTALVALIVLWGFYIFDKKLNLKILVLFIMAIIIILIVFVYTSPLEEVQRIYATSGERVGSTSTHLDLLIRGYQLLTGDVKTFFIGKGWGTEYVYTKDFFGDSKYGNFHSGILSVFIQSGVFACFIYIYYIMRPMIHSLRFIPIVLIIIWSNVFYQFNSDPLYWIVLAILNSDFMINYRGARKSQEISELNEEKMHAQKNYI